MKNLRTHLACFAALLAIVLTAFAPATASAQSAWKHRQDQKNTWRNLGYAGAGLGILGLLTKNNTLTWAGFGSGLYSAYRYEQDRKSQSKMAKARYNMFRRTSVWHNGHRYNRKTVWRNGHKYYTFVRAR